MILHSLKWNTITTGLRTGLSLVRYLYIGRRLPPAAFGVYGLAYGLIQTVALSKRLGSNGSTITSELTPEQHGSLWTLDLLLGLLLYSLIWQLAPTLAAWHTAPALSPVLRRLALILMLTGFTEHWYLRLQRAMRWRLLGLLRVGSMAAGLLTLYLTRSLVAETLARYAISVAVVAAVGLRQFPMPLCFRGDSLRFSFAYGSNEISRHTAGHILGQLSSLLLMRAFGPAAMGVYRMAAKLATQGPRRLNPILTKILLPAFSRLSDGDGRRLLRRSVRWLALANAALAGVIIFAAPFVLGWLFGSQWQAAIPLARVLAAAAAFEAVADPVIAWLLSRARLGRVFAFDLVRSALDLLAALGAVSLGSLLGLAWLRVGSAALLAAWAAYQIQPFPRNRDHSDSTSPIAGGPGLSDQP
jgi:lipopolysaccharide exporter